MTKRRPSLALTLLWLLVTLLPWATWWSRIAPPWTAVALLLHFVLFAGTGYLASGRWGYGAAWLVAMALALAQSAPLWSGEHLWPGLLLFIGLAGALSGMLLWRWRLEHYGADLHFDLIAPWYERFIHPQKPERLLEALDIAPTHRILDVGGGTGRVAQFLQPARLVVVADLSMAMLRHAHHKKGLRPTAALAEALPFAPGTFERVIMVDALHHLFNQRDAVGELWRVLAPGGRLIIEEPDIAHPLVKLIALWEKAMLMRSHFLRAERIAALLPSEARVRIVRQDGIAHVIADKPSP